MALIKCHECGKEISTKAKECPHCGAPAKSPIKFRWWAFIVIGVIAGIYYSIESTTNNAKTSGTKTSQTDKDPRLKWGKAADCITIEDHQWGSDYVAKHKIKVKNFCTKSVKDIQFGFDYYADSGTKLSTGYETAYEIFPAGKYKTVELSELAPSKAVKSHAYVHKAKWLWQEGEPNLDF